MNLYWVDTPDHAEDWFIVARTNTRAARWHERAEGYAPRDARATLVVRISGNLDAQEGWPTEELLEACGARVDRSGTPRTIRIGGKRFVEGYLEYEICQLADELFEALGKGRPNKTSRRSVQ